MKRKAAGLIGVMALLLALTAGAAGGGATRTAPGAGALTEPRREARAEARVEARPLPPQRMDRPPDPANATYRISGSPVTLECGRSGASGIRLSGLTSYGDMNGDGRPDVAVLLLGAEGAGYLAALLGDGAGGGAPVEAVWLGERILPEGLAVVGSEAIVTYRLHSPHAPPDGKPRAEGYVLKQGRLVRAG